MVTRVFDILSYQLEKYNLSEALVTKYKGEWQAESTASYIEKANQVSKGLLELGVERGDKILIVTSTNRTEWNILDIGIQQIGAISVPVYPTISAEDYSYIFNHSEACLCFISDQVLYDRIQQVFASTLLIKDVYTFEQIPGVHHWEEILEKGENSDKQAELDAIKATILPDDMLTLIYTSGTTGKPKGVVLTHKNIVSNVLSCEERIPNGVGKALSFLPCCHVFERMLLYMYQYMGVSIYFAEGIDKISDNAKEIHPHIMTVVPRLLEKVYDKIIAKGQELKGVKYALFFWAVQEAEKYKPFREQGLWYDMKLKVANKLIFSKWREALGGNIKVLVSGSAPLQSRLVKVFTAAQIPVLEGYGLTETSPVISVNAFGKDMFLEGTVGKPIKGVSVAFSEDGEILVKGDNVMKGYYKDPQQTAEAFTSQGYFKTGDIGELTPEGLLKITDRKKEMFKTSGGKYVAPQLIENMIKASRFIEQIMVVGSGEKMPCAFIQLDFDFIRSWIKQKEYQVDTTSNEKIVSDPKVIKRIDQIIEHYNDKLGQWEKIKKYTLTPGVWSVESGHLTPTLKLRRKIIREEIYHEEYEKMYDRI